jgi:hypothetical protein
MIERGNVMQTGQSGTSEIAIFSRVLEHDLAMLSDAAADSILNLGFSQADKARMAELSAKAGEGLLSSDEQAEINNYEKVGHILALMKSKARRSLERRNATNGATAH